MSSCAISRPRFGIEEMYRAAPVIYVDFTDYDEVAHHAGIDRVEAHEALDGIDRYRDPREGEPGRSPTYRFVVLSDHGQSPGAMFRQRTACASSSSSSDTWRRCADAPVGPPEHADRMGILMRAGPSFAARLLRPIVLRATVRSRERRSPA